MVSSATELIISPTAEQKQLLLPRKLLFGRKPASRDFPHQSSVCHDGSLSSNMLSWLSPGAASYPGSHSHLMMVQSLAAENMAKSSGVMTKHVMDSWWPRKTRMSSGAGAWIWAGKGLGHCSSGHYETHPQHHPFPSHPHWPKGKQAQRLPRMRTLPNYICPGVHCVSEQRTPQPETHWAICLQIQVKQVIPSNLIAKCPALLPPLQLTSATGPSAQAA